MIDKDLIPIAYQVKDSYATIESRGIKANKARAAWVVAAKGMVLEKYRLEFIAEPPAPYHLMGIHMAQVGFDTADEALKAFRDYQEKRPGRD